MVKVLSDSLEEFKRILERVSVSIIKSFFVVNALVYLGWSVWLLIVLITMLFFWRYDLPREIYYIFGFTTFIVALYINNNAMPKVIFGIIKLSSGVKLRDSDYYHVTRRRINAFALTFWIIGILIYIILTMIIYPYLSIDLRKIIGSLGLILMLSIGNLGVFLAYRIYGGISVRYAYVIIGIMILSSIALPIFADNYFMLWTYTLSILIISYVLLAIYCLILALR